MYRFHENVRIVTISWFSSVEAFHLGVSLCEAIETFEGVWLLYFFLAVLGSGEWIGHDKGSHTEYEYHGWVLKVGRYEETGKHNHVEYQQHGCFLV